jgi:hypothetical protein
VAEGDVADDVLGPDRVLDIYNLHVRHPGMAAEITSNFAVNAAVCMDRHEHASPLDWSVRKNDEPEIAYLLRWEAPSADQKRSCANHDDATRDGAYGLALASADAHLQYVALRRAEGRSGSDFYLVPDGADVAPEPEYDLDRDDLVRLEVSGIYDDDDAKMSSRLSQKVTQAIKGRSHRPAIVSVVGFRSARVFFRDAVV